MICPGCNKESKTLENYQAGTRCSTFRLDGRLDFKFCSDGKKDNYYCHYCGLILATSEEDALELLNRECNAQGHDPVTEIVKWTLIEGGSNLAGQIGKDRLGIIKTTTCKRCGKVLENNYLTNEEVENET